MVEQKQLINTHQTKEITENKNLDARNNGYARVSDMVIDRRKGKHAK